MEEHKTTVAPATMDTSNSVIRLETVTKDYHMGEVVVQALRGVSLNIDKGEYVALMGPSGSGKSTMMHIIGCLDTPTDGDVWVDNELLDEVSEKELAYIRNEKVGFVFQQFNLLAKTSILNNVMTPLMYQGVSYRERKKLAKEALERVGLGDRIHHRPNELSGGQRQRAAIARAIVTDPSIILADEPTGALDSKTGMQIMELFEELHEEGATVIIVTHDQKLGMRCDRQIHLLDGQIV